MVWNLNVELRPALPGESKLRVVTWAARGFMTELMNKFNANEDDSSTRCEHPFPVISACSESALNNHVKAILRLGVLLKFQIFGLHTFIS